MLLLIPDSSTAGADARPDTAPRDDAPTHPGMCMYICNTVSDHEKRHTISKLEKERQHREFCCRQSIKTSTKEITFCWCLCRVQRGKTSIWCKNAHSGLYINVTQQRLKSSQCPCWAVCQTPWSWFPYDPTQCIFFQFKKKILPLYFW